MTTTKTATPKATPKATTAKAWKGITLADFAFSAREFTSAVRITLLKGDRVAIAQLGKVTLECKDKDGKKVALKPSVLLQLAEERMVWEHFLQCRKAIALQELLSAYSNLDKAESKVAELRLACVPYLNE